MNILITNRQRSQPVDTDRIAKMADKLARALCQNLLNQPTKHLLKNEINAICANADLSIVLVSNVAIRKLNKQWRNKNYETDVLSFPLEIYPPSPGITWELGEIFVSIDKAIEQAQSYNHSLDRELAFLIIHGMLHVLGFDHEEPREEKEMFGRQKAILKAAGYPRA